MQKWIICKYGANHIQSPYECDPVGLAYEKTAEDRPESSGFIDIGKFSDWLKKKDLCAFSEGYKKALGITSVNSLPTMYASD